MADVSRNPYGMSSFSERLSPLLAARIFDHRFYQQNLRNEGVYTGEYRCSKEDSNNVSSRFRSQSYDNGKRHRSYPFDGRHHYKKKRSTHSNTQEPNFTFHDALPGTSCILNENDGQAEECQSSSMNILKVFLWPAFVICIPIALLCTVLLYIVFQYEVEPRISLFQPSMSLSQYQRMSYILVDFSATQIVFLASFLSTVAPLLAGCVMSLTSILICRDLRQSSDSHNFSMLPSPYQMSLLVGILAASYEQLLSSMGYLLSRKRTTKAPPVLLYAASLLILSVMLGVAVTTTDAVLHYVTQTISFDLYSMPSIPRLQYGRGLNSVCADFDRVNENFGFPCTMAASSEFVDLNSFSEQAEIQHLMHNTSSVSEIRHGLLNDGDEIDISFLVPKPVTLSPGTDFQATTFGVASECQLIPPTSCNITSWGPNGNIYTSFNCSESFWGVLGMSPNITETNSYREPSAYISFLAIKAQSNLQYSYFMDENLEVVYNPAGLNDSGMQGTNIDMLQNDQLPNPMYMAFAWRSSINAFSGGLDNEMTKSPKALYNTEQHWLDYFLTCKLTSYEVEYVWFNGSVESIAAVEHNNGTMLNMWQGLTNYGASIAGSGHTYQDYNFQAAIAGNTTSSYEQKFGQLLSDQVLATIGGYSSGRTVLQQQERRTLLLAKVPKAALGSLIACSLIYPILGAILAFKALRSSRDDASMKDLFSYWGLASAAWYDEDERRRSRVVTPDQVKSGGHEEDMRLFVRGDTKKGYRFGVWKRSKSGNMVEIQRSQTDVATYI